MEHTYIKSLAFWDKLSDDEKKEILSSTLPQHNNKGSIIHHSNSECSGVEIVKSGLVRVFITSPNGGEITLYRLLPDDVCILSAACMIKNLNLEINMEFEEESDIFIIPKSIFKKISDENPYVKEYTLNLVSEKFSEVMWLFNQYVFSNMAKRLADSLLNHASLADSNQLSVTHEILAKDLGTAREVVTRLLKQFQTDGIVRLSRGKIEILSTKKLMEV